jgi:hypothetical protein
MAYSMPAVGEVVPRDHGNSEMDKLITMVPHLLQMRQMAQYHEAQLAERAQAIQNAADYHANMLAERGIRLDQMAADQEERSKNHQAFATNQVFGIIEKDPRDPAVYDLARARAAAHGVTNLVVGDDGETLFDRINLLEQKSKEVPAGSNVGTWGQDLNKHGARKAPDISAGEKFQKMKEAAQEVHRVSTEKGFKQIIDPASGKLTDELDPLTNKKIPYNPNSYNPKDVSAVSEHLGYMDKINNALNVANGDFDEEGNVTPSDMRGAFLKQFSANINKAQNDAVAAQHATAEASIRERMRREANETVGFSWDVSPDTTGASEIPSNPDQKKMFAWD